MGGTSLLPQRAPREWHKETTRMKAGFKPKLFTKKEWEDNRSPTAKGSGVGKALDAWNAKCPNDLQNITLKEIAEAFSTATALDKALEVARKKCDPKAQKETIAGIEAYKTVVDNYQKALKAANVALNKRKALAESLTFDVVYADKELLGAFVTFTKKVAYIYEILHTKILWDAKKYEEAVKLYGKDNDYNVEAKTNKALMDAFGGKDRGQVDLKVLAEAIKTVPNNLMVMLRDSRHYQGSSASFDKYPAFLAICEKRHPIANFSI
jgi:hypothetical protein